MPLNNFGVVIPGKLYRSAQPDEDGWKQVRALEITTIYKLNSDKESDPIAEQARGFEVIEDEPDQWCPSVDWCRGAVERLRDCTEPTLIHCTKGRDRTGFLCAAHRVLEQHWSADDALKEFYAFGVTGFIRWADHEIEECIRKLAEGAA